MKVNLIGMILSNAGRSCFEGAVLDDSGKPLSAAESLHTLIMEYAKVANGGASDLVAASSVVPTPGEASDPTAEDAAHLLRFMCQTWSQMDAWAREHCADMDAIDKYPVIQGTSNQIKLLRIGEQSFDPKRLQAGMQWMLGNKEQGASTP